MSKELISRYHEVRRASMEICKALEPDDFTCQPELHVSPPKWHIAHSTWFFEHFILREWQDDFRPFHPQYHFLFNSYYETAGDHLGRNRRGAMTRPTTSDVMRYRSAVDEAMDRLLESRGDTIGALVETGLNHEQQHQELLWMDIKYILGTNPLFPSYPAAPSIGPGRPGPAVHSEGGVFEVGHGGPGFHFDNEAPRHKVYLEPYSIAAALVTNAEYREFIQDGGYRQVDLWHSDGWEWVGQNKIAGPLYWHERDGAWLVYTFDGLAPLRDEEPVCHVSQYEAFAYANWKGRRLPTEFEWEVASPRFGWGQLWEHTASAYLPYPGYRKPDGTLGEYNAKFMANQMVLRGACSWTPAGHGRTTYRNFFSPSMRWQFAGIRLADEIR